MNDAGGALDPDRIEAGRGGGRIGRKVLVFRETASTNDLAIRLAEAGEAEGIVVFAERQTAGRGQHGRKWESADGAGLWFSILLRPAWPAALLQEITPMVAVVVARAIEEVIGQTPRIKPPNDIMLHGRKAAGILTDARTGSQIFAVVGIGINVRQRREDFPPALRETATSLEIEAGAPVSREELACAVLRGFNAAYGPERPPGGQIADAYAALSRRPVCDSFPP